VQIERGTPKREMPGLENPFAMWKHRVDSSKEASWKSSQDPSVVIYLRNVRDRDRIHLQSHANALQDGDCRNRGLTFVLVSILLAQVRQLTIGLPVLLSTFVGVVTMVLLMTYVIMPCVQSY
jgi:hypothetical protein